MKSLLFLYDDGNMSSILVCGTVGGANVNISVAYCTTVYKMIHDIMAILIRGINSMKLMSELFKVETILLRCHDM